MGGEDFLYANRTRTGIEIMSINLLLPNETDPVVCAARSSPAP